MWGAVHKHDLFRVPLPVPILLHKRGRRERKGKRGERERERGKMAECAGQEFVGPVQVLSDPRFIETLSVEKERWRPYHWVGHSCRAPPATAPPESIVRAGRHPPAALERALCRWLRGMPRVSLLLENLLGEGGYGSVYEATLTRAPTTAGDEDDDDDDEEADADAEAEATHHRPLPEEFQRTPPERTAVWRGVLKLVALPEQGQLDAFRREVDYTRRAAQLGATPALWTHLVLVDGQRRACGALLQGRAGVPLAALAHQRAPPAALPYPFPDVMEAVGRQLPALLCALHRAGVAHGDLMPSNIVLTALPLEESRRRHRRAAPVRVQLIDFGLAMPADAALESVGHYYPYTLAPAVRGAEVDLVFASRMGAALWEHFPRLASPSMMRRVLADHPEKAHPTPPATGGM